MGGGGGTEEPNDAEAALLLVASVLTALVSAMLDAFVNDGVNVAVGLFMLVGGVYEDVLGVGRFT